MSQLWNHVKMNHGTPVVGEGATIFSWTDRDAATVVKVTKSGKTAWVVEDKAERTDNNGMSESQVYTYTKGNGEPKKCTLRKNGEWRMSNNGRKIVFGVRETYYDYTF